MLTRFGLAACAAVLVCASIFLLHHLGTEPLQDYDEATYAQVVHEALTDHHYLSYTEGGTDYFKKPPLAFWAMEVSETALGETPFAMRLPFALSGIAVLAVLMLLIYEITGNGWIAALGGAVLATTAPFMETARQVRLDVPVILFILLAVYCFVRGLKNPKWFLGFGAAVGLAIMVKSVIAAFAVVAALFILLVYRRFDLFKNKYAYGSIGMALLVAAPWHLWEWVHFGSAFWAQYIGVEVVDRTQGNLFWTVSLTNADYIWYLQNFTQPWLDMFFIAIAAVAAGWKWLPRTSRRFAEVSLATIATMVAVFFSAKTKAPTYLLPVYPFAAIVIALTTTLAPPPAGKYRRAILSAVCALAVLLLYAAAQTTYYDAYHFNPYYSVELAMAVDEKAVARPLSLVPKDTPVYVYDDTNLGSVEYYSQHLYLLPLMSTSTLQKGTYIVLDSTGTTTLAQNFPQIKTQTIYSGPQVTLLRI